jgi:hypothetical protein
MRTTALAFTLVLGVAQATHAESFRFVALGDMPYGAPEKVYGPYEQLIRTVNARRPALVIHVGDVKSGSTPCSDELLRDQRAFLDRFEAPVLYTPGDNEWTDCHREKAGGFDPLERLAFLRRSFFDDPSRSLGGAPVTVESQALIMPAGHADFPENQRYRHGGVLFVTLHVVGSNNNFEIRSPAAASEFFARERAALAWLSDSFAEAARNGDRAVVVAIQADMFESGFDREKETFAGHSGFGRIGSALAREAAAFARPVLLIYGDSHLLRLDQPFRRTAPNLLALQVFGDEDMHAVEVGIDTDDPAVFSFRPVWNPAIAGSSPRS